MADPIRIAFLHLAPRPDDLAANRERVRAAVLQAADAGAEWVLTPELSTSGYAFAETLGLGWIQPAPDVWAADIAAIAAKRDLAIFLATAERDLESGLLHNSVLVFDGELGFVGSHRKINTLKVGSEAWSSPGSAATVVGIRNVGKVGLLLCADACSPQLGAEMKSQGARVLVSSANWSPGEWGPAGEWELWPQQRDYRCSSVTEPARTPDCPLLARKVWLSRELAGSFRLTRRSLGSSWSTGISPLIA